MKTGFWRILDSTQIHWFRTQCTKITRFSLCTQHCYIFTRGNLNTFILKLHSRYTNVLTVYQRKLAFILSKIKLRNVFLTVYKSNNLIFNKCNELWFSNLYIFETSLSKPLLFQTLTIWSCRVHNLTSGCRVIGLFSFFQCFTSTMK